MVNRVRAENQDQQDPISSATDIHTELPRPKSCSKYMSSCIAIFSLANSEILGRSPLLQAITQPARRVPSLWPKRTFDSITLPNPAIPVK